jgi:3-methylcrotonyl-CoA carboxylase alpha subunit
LRQSTSWEALLFQRLFIANRGEIACRIIKTAKKLGIISIVAYSDVDANSRFVRMADIAIPFDGIDAQSTYLNIEKIIKIAKDNDAQAIHPGYGFLSENGEFAQICAQNNIVFVGASAQAINLMGLKDSAKQIAKSANVPIIKGYYGENQDDDFLLSQANDIGFPLLIKAIAGGGGRGIREVNEVHEFSTMLENARREAKSAFNDDRIMLERLIQNPRHIEVQVFGDNYGNIVHLFERDCSVQRRRQKIIEEAPAPNLPEDVRIAMQECAIKLAQAVSYQGAGTIEFIVDGNGVPTIDSFWFLEMNTRLQVEHPVTEAITNIDLVEWQLRIAAGEKLPMQQSQIKSKGHAIEVRIIAEDPNNNFLPSAGIYNVLHQFDGIRIDTGFENGDYIPSNYDSLIEKLICHAPNRDQAIEKIQKQLECANYLGFANNAGYIGRILHTQDFNNANISTLIIENNQNTLVRLGGEYIDNIACAAIAQFEFVNNFGNLTSFRLNAIKANIVKFEIDKKSHFVEIKNLSNSYIIIDENGAQFQIEKEKICKLGNNKIEFTHNQSRIFAVKCDNDIMLYVKGETYHYCASKDFSDYNSNTSSNEIVANLPGKIVAINNVLGDKVQKGQVVIIIEAMKMEHSLIAQIDGEIIALDASLGAQVKLGQTLARLG